MPADVWAFSNIMKNSLNYHERSGEIWTEYKNEKREKCSNRKITTVWYQLRDPRPWQNDKRGEISHVRRECWMETKAAATHSLHIIYHPSRLKSTFIVTSLLSLLLCEHFATLNGTEPYLGNIFHNFKHHRDVISVWTTSSERLFSIIRKRALCRRLGSGE